MSKGIIPINDELYDYILSVSLREDPLYARLRAETDDLGDRSRMQISPDQGAFMAMLTRLTGARKYLEIGVFTGYSALCVADAMPAVGKVTGCDVSEEWTAIARKYWREAGVDDKIDLVLAPAGETLQKLRDGGAEGTYDLAFIDADKESYDLYYEHCLALMKPGGLIILDNVLWGGSVIDPAADDIDTRAIRDVNEKIHTDKRVTLSLVPIGDGLTLARKNN